MSSRAAASNFRFGSNRTCGSITHFKLTLEGRLVKLKKRSLSQTCGLYYKSFMIVIYDRNDSTIVIYDHNDSGQYYKTINYDPRVVIYYPSLSNY
jgi:hypothetical protein